MVLFLRECSKSDTDPCWDLKCFAFSFGIRLSSHRSSFQINNPKYEAGDSYKEDFFFIRIYIVNFKNSEIGNIASG